jgi:FkbM family methyltransferase
MPSAQRLVSVLRNRRVPLRTRTDLALAEGRRRLRPGAAYPVRHGPVRVFLSHDDYDVDWESLKFVVVDEAYRGDYAKAVVVDLGAHKGYFGAYVLARGARVVISYEPERANAGLLERAAAGARVAGREWTVVTAAVGATAGEADIHVMAGSWAHSLRPPDSWREHEVGTQPVRVEAMSAVLRDATGAAGDGRLVVKINIEGEECAVVLETPAGAWERVDELFVEMHPWVTCTAAELAAHLASAGLRQAPSAMEPVLRLRRE